MKTSSTIPIAIIVAGAILAGAVYVSVRSTVAPLATVNNHTSAAAVIHAKDHILGSPTAKIKIIEYADFDCEPCKDFNGALRQVVSDFGPSSGVAWVSRSFALTELHPNAKQHARAAECVAQTAGNDAYFKFNALLFANQPASPTNYAEYALAAGAPPEAVAECIRSTATNGIDAKIDAERVDALAMGAQGAPFSLLIAEGKPPVIIDSAWPYADLKDALDAALKNI